MIASVDPPRTALRPYRFTYDEVLTMVEAGILRENEKLELIDGRLIKMAHVGDAHIACSTRLNHALHERIFDGDFDTIRVSLRNPLKLDPYHVPRPDVVLTNQDAAIPTPGTTLLVVEVSDTTLDYDRDTKLPLYAEADIPEVWIVNLDARQVEVYRDPKGSDYTLRLLRDASTSVDIAALPDIDPLAVSDLLPPEDASNVSSESNTA